MHAARPLAPHLVLPLPALLWSSPCPATCRAPVFCPTSAAYDCAALSHARPLARSLPAGTGCRAPTTFTHPRRHAARSATTWHSWWTAPTQSTAGSTGAGAFCMPLATAQSSMLGGCVPCLLWRARWCGVSGLNASAQPSKSVPFKSVPFKSVPCRDDPVIFSWNLM